jgi:hypothetical protein
MQTPISVADAYSPQRRRIKYARLYETRESTHVVTRSDSRTLGARSRRRASLRANPATSQEPGQPWLHRSHSAAYRWHRRRRFALCRRRFRSSAIRPLASKDTRGSGGRVQAGAPNTISGFDGLYWYRGGLVAIQNGMGLPRVAQFQLSPDGSHVTASTVLEYRSDYVELPTTVQLTEPIFISWPIPRLTIGKTKKLSILRSWRRYASRSFVCLERRCPSL